MVNFSHTGSGLNALVPQSFNQDEEFEKEKH